MTQERLYISRSFQSTQNKKLYNSVFIIAICITLLRFYCQKYSAIINNNKFTVTDDYDPSEPITTQDNKDDDIIPISIQYKSIPQEPCQKPYRNPYKEKIIRRPLRGHYSPIIPHQS